MVCHFLYSNCLTGTPNRYATFVNPRNGPSCPLLPNTHLNRIHRPCAYHNDLKPFGFCNPHRVGGPRACARRKRLSPGLSAAPSRGCAQTCSPGRIAGAGPLFHRTFQGCARGAHEARLPTVRPASRRAGRRQAALPAYPPAARACGLGAPHIHSRRHADTNTRYPSPTARRVWSSICALMCKHLGSCSSNPNAKCCGLCPVKQQVISFITAPPPNLCAPIIPFESRFRQCTKQPVPNPFSTNSSARNIPTCRPLLISNCPPSAFSTPTPSRIITNPHTSGVFQRFRSSPFSGHSKSR